MRNSKSIVDHMTDSPNPKSLTVVNSGLMVITEAMTMELLNGISGESFANLMAMGK